MTILARVDVGEHVGRDQFAALVIAVGIVGLENAQTVLDGQAGRDDQETARELLAVRADARR